MTEIQHKLVHKFSSVKVRELIGKEWNLEIYNRDICIDLNEGGDINTRSLSILLNLFLLEVLLDGGLYKSSVLVLSKEKIQWRDLIGSLSSKVFI